MRRRAAPVVAGLLVAAYVAAFRRYGIYDLADEGLLLAQAARAAAGERPYLDFHTGYGPLYFAVQSRLLEAGGLDAIRGALAVVHGVTAGLTFALARPTGRWRRSSRGSDAARNAASFARSQRDPCFRAKRMAFRAAKYLRTRIDSVVPWLPRPVCVTTTRGQ